MSAIKRFTDCHHGSWQKAFQRVRIPDASSVPEPEQGESADDHQDNQ